MALLEPRVFLLDTFALIFRAYHSRAHSRSTTGGLRTTDGRPTQATFGINNTLRRMLDKYRPEYVVAVWEGSGPTYRDDEYPEYKANRDALPEDLAAELPQIRRLLRALNVPVVAEDGYEADDTIALLASQAVEAGLSVTVVSMDKDLMQLVGERVTMLDIRRNARYDAADVEKRLGVRPRRVADLLALKGDSADNIPGAPGIGQKGAEKLIAKYGRVETIIEHAAEVKRKTYRESLINNADQIRMSKSLATLNTSGTAKLDLVAAERRDPDHDALLQLYREFEFVSLARKLQGRTAAKKEAAPTPAFESAGQIREWLAASKGPVALAVRATRPEGIEIGLSAGEDDTWLAPPELALACRELIESDRREVWVHDRKSAIHSLRERGIDFSRDAEDTMLMAFLADSSRTNHALEKASERRLGAAVPSGAGHAARATWALRDILVPEIERLGLESVYREIELPLAPVLAEMEAVGIRIDPGVLADLSKRLAEGIAEIQAEVFELAGREFKIGSPKQLGQVLYRELGLPEPRKRGKTKAPSTASDVLERLRSKHPIPGLVLEWRKRTKLKNTYVDSLPGLADSDNRLHTTFNPTGSATGRLSSANPNLQNLPARTALGREIRRAFVAAPGWQFVSADYSQVELRVLAHLSGDPTLLDAFNNGQDLHRRTASEVLGIPPEMVGPDERSRAKAVNFGIVYGLSPFGLARQLQIPQAVAKDYIGRYFDRYTGVRDFNREIVERTRETGYSETLFGRRRPVPNLKSRNRTARGFAERIAINSPIQGTAADLIKKAMLATRAALRQAGLRAKMVLQIHDSLLIEAPDDEMQAVPELVRNEMESVAELAVPLLVDVKVGPNMADVKDLPRPAQ